jgi:hypothetical protein
MPSRNTSVTATCSVCAAPLPPGRARRTCSDACRQAAWRRRHQPEPTTPVLPTSRPRKAGTIYECPDCETRLLGTQICPTCHSFMRRLGSGGSCPSCDEPVTFEDLLDP